MSVLLFAALAAVATGAPDTAIPAKPANAAPSAQVAAAAKPAGSNPDEVVCQRTEVTGSHLPTRVCHTRAQWKQLSLDAQDYLSRPPAVNASGK